MSRSVKKNVIVAKNDQFFKRYGNKKLRHKAKTAIQKEKEVIPSKKNEGVDKWSIRDWSWRVPKTSKDYKVYKRK